MNIKELLKADKQFDKKSSNRILLCGIILLLLGFIGFFISLDGRSMRKGVALLYIDTKIASLYKYYPILLLVSLLLIAFGSILLLIKFMNEKKFKQIHGQATYNTQYEVPQAETIAKVETMPQAETIAKVETMPQAETIAKVETMPQAETIAKVETMPQAEAVPKAENTSQKEVICNSCQQTNKSDSKFCVACGHQLK